MYTPVHCHISSDKAGLIEKRFASDPDHAGRVMGIHEFNDLSMGHLDVFEIVFVSDDWSVFEDGLLIATGKRRAGARAVGNAAVKTPYLRTFLDALDE